MQGVALHTSGEATLQMEVLFEIVEDGFNLRPAFEEFPLAFGHELFLLLVVRRYYEDSTVHSIELLVQGTPVATVANCYFGVLIDKIWYCSTVMSNCTAENVGTELSVIVDAGMQLEAIVLTLPVMPVWA
jgi:hypothetical protein